MNTDNRKLRVALVGCGSISESHLRALIEEEDLSITALCDIRRERAEDKAKKYAPSARIYGDFDRMMEESDFDVLHITTPHYLHAPMAIAALAKDRNVFLEKPAAISEEQLSAMLKAEAESEGRIAVCFQNRFNTATILAENLVAEHGGAKAARGMVTWYRSEPYYTESGWRGSYATEGGGVMINQAIHTLDLMLQLCGTPESVTGTIANHHLKGVIEVEDTCECQIRFASGAQGLFFASTAFATDAPVFLEIFTQDGTTVTINGGNLYCNGVPVAENAAHRDENLHTLGKPCWGNGHGKLIHMYYEALRTGSPMPVTLASAEPAVQVLLAAYASKDHPVVISPLSEN